MNLHRDIIFKLNEWKNSSSRLPLIIKGARQVGKTWCMKEFGRKFFSKVAYFNFESDTELKKDFHTTKDPLRLLSILELYCGIKIEADNTLIIFDEIQECNDALISLKYFAEETPQYHIISAGSLLGVALQNQSSFPVGKVDFMDMFPLTFKEFLISADTEIYKFFDDFPLLSIPAIIINKLNEWYRKYLICGGIPKAVLAMLEDGNIQSVDYELERLLTSYSLDFSKHVSSSTVPKISAIWNSIPSQLTKENKKFIYGAVKTGARAREYEEALNWLELSGLIYKIYDTELPYLPLKSYDNLSAFKIYLFDIGILRILAQLPASILISDSLAFREFKGAFAENAVLQNLIPQFRITPRYWTSKGKAEIDFLLQFQDSVYPIEVKASDNKSGKSLKIYIDKFQPKKSVIISSETFRIEKDIIHIPHGLTPWLKEILKSQ